MITYNHEFFLAQAIESVVMQETHFLYELIIGEDCSTDRTRQICLDYQKKYPEKIHLLLHETNRGMMPNFFQTLETCTGKYIALLEGDDYWTDPYKLQKQVAFLEAQPDFVTCFHRVKILDNEGLQKRNLEYLLPGKKAYYTVDDLLEHSCFIPTCSTLTRNHLFPELPDWLRTVTLGDIAYQILNALHGKIGFLDETMAVYRVHPGGVGSSQTATTILEKTVQTYRALGTQLHLQQRASYRHGLVKFYLSLGHAYIGAQQYRKACATIYQAFTQPHLPFLIVSQGVSAGIRPIWRGLLQPLRRMRIWGLGWLKSWCGEACYQKLKTKFQRISSQKKGGSEA